MTSALSSWSLIPSLAATKAADAAAAAAARPPPPAVTDLLPATSFTLQLLAAALALAGFWWVSVGCVACAVADAELAGAWSAPCCMPTAGAPAAAAAAAATMRVGGLVVRLLLLLFTHRLAGSVTGGCTRLACCLIKEGAHPEALLRPYGVTV